MKPLTVSCPITKVAELLSDPWTMLIMHYLIEGPKRFCDLERVLSGISTRTLTLKLKKLAADGMVEKTSEGLYRTTKKGSGLKLVESAMHQYEKRYL